MKIAVIGSIIPIKQLCPVISISRVVKGVGHLGHDEAMEAGVREFSLHGRVAKGVGHPGHDEAICREFDPRPGH